MHIDSIYKIYFTIGKYMRLHIKLHFDFLQVSEAPAYEVKFQAGHKISNVDWTNKKAVGNNIYRLNWKFQTSI